MSVQIDITEFEAAGFTAWEPPEITYDSNNRNGFKYIIRFLNLGFNFEERKMTGRFRVIRQVMQNGNWETDLSYVFDSVADELTSVDKFGNIVPETIKDDEDNDIPNPIAWGDEFKRMRVLFNSPLKDSDMCMFYQQALFDLGRLDFPKNRSV